MNDLRVTSEAVQSELDRRLEASLRVGEDVLARAGGLALDARTVKWRAVDQLTRAASDSELPGTTIGGVVLEVTRRTADGARRASALADGARSFAADGHAAMLEVDGAIAGLHSSAERTSQIIKDVSEISFQTHLLGPNAAVEAARAGDAGQGFAVVADEVRALARRAKEAASSTEALLQQSMRDTEAGAARAHQAAARLGAIVGEQVSSVAGEIAASAREGSAAIDGVNRSVSQVGQVTQTNAAGAEESSAAAQELLAQAQGLAEAVASFQVDASAEATSMPAFAVSSAPRPGPSDARARRTV